MQSDWADFVVVVTLDFNDERSPNLRYDQPVVSGIQNNRQKGNHRLNRIM